MFGEPRCFAYLQLCGTKFVEAYYPGGGRVCLVVFTQCGKNNGSWPLSKDTIGSRPTSESSDHRSQFSRFDDAAVR
jgi:hypothetical protein